MDKSNIKKIRRKKGFLGCSPDFRLAFSVLYFSPHSLTFFVLRWFFLSLKSGAMSDSNESIGWEYLPDEILTRIFTFLPIKSIIICTSVSKTWKSLIQNPTFISTHLHHSHNKIKNNLLLLSLSDNLCLGID